MGHFAMALLFGGIALLLVLRRRPRVMLSDAEGATVLAFGLLALTQGALQSQVQVDDVFFTAMYLVVVGHVTLRHGPDEGFVGTLLGVGLLILVAGLHPFGEAPALASDTPSLEGLAQGALAGLAVVNAAGAEWLTLGIALIGVVGAVSGLARWRPAWAPLGAVTWLLIPLAIQPDILCAATPWIATVAAVSVLMVVENLKRRPVEGL